MIVAGEKLHHEIKRSHGRPLRSFSYLPFFSFAQLWEGLKLWNVLDQLTRPLNHSGPSNVGSWSRRKARKMLDDESFRGVGPTTDEYAKETKILEAPSLELLYYADAVGRVPEPRDPTGFVDPPSDPFDIGNGDLPPEWGVDVAVRGGVVRYGPWSDRQR